MSIGALAAAVALLFANGWFVASEFALVASRWTRLELLAADGNRRAKIALAASRDLRSQLAGAQLGVTVASLLLGFVAEAAVAEGLSGLFESVTGWSDAVRHSVAVVVALALVVLLHITLGEMVPKNLAIAGPERALLLMAPVNRVVFAVFRPVIVVLTSMGNLVVRLLGMRPTDEIATPVTARELASLVDESRLEGELDDFEHALITGALELGERSVGSVMVPRHRIVSVRRRFTVREVEQVVVSSGHSRLLVLGAGGIDNVLGFVHAKDLLRLPPAAADEPVPLELVRRLLVVRADEPLEQVLVTMRRQRRHLAVVQDTVDRTVGIVALEDLLQVLVGMLSAASDERVEPPPPPDVTERGHSTT